MALCGLILVWSSAPPSRAREIDFAPYARAVDYCRGDVARPMALSPDKRVLCFDDWIFPGQDISLANSLRQGGYFVVRGSGGDVETTIALASVIGAKRATVVIYDYCLGACADYLFIASAEIFVTKASLVAWTYMVGPQTCVGWADAPDHGPPLLTAGPCRSPLSDSSDYSFGSSNYLKLIDVEQDFYKGRVISPPFMEPPESFTVRKILRQKFDETGRYPEVFWTWNPRYYSSWLKTKVVYEAYPQDQDQVNDLAARIGLRYQVIYDP